MSPDLRHELTDAGRRARENDARTGQPGSAFADRLSASMRRKLDDRATQTERSSGRGIGLRVSPGLLGATFLLAFAATGLAWAAGLVPVIDDRAAASPSAVASVPSATPSAELAPTATPSVDSTASVTVEPVQPPPTEVASTPAVFPTPTQSPTATATPHPTRTLAPTSRPTTRPAPTPSPTPTSKPIVDLGVLRAADNLDLTVTFSWNPYVGSGLTAYAVFYEPTSSGLAPTWPVSKAWATAPATKTSVSVPGIAAGDYQVRAQALCGPAGALFVCGQTSVIHVHLSASRGATPTPPPSPTPLPTPAPTPVPTPTA